MDEERDFIVVTDDDNNEIELDVLGYFTYEEEEYAVVYDASTIGEDEEPEMYIMKVIVNGDTEEFVSVDDDKFETLVALVQEALENGDIEDCDCGCCHDDCDCDCDDDCDREHEHHDCSCGCGCDHE